MLSQKAVLDGEMLSTKLAYLTMYEFLERYAHMNDSRDIRRLDNVLISAHNCRSSGNG